MSNELKSSYKWLELKNKKNYPINIVISDCDGWQGSLDELITDEEFEKRLKISKTITQNLFSDGSTDFYDHVPGLD